MMRKWRWTISLLLAVGILLSGCSEQAETIKLDDPAYMFGDQPGKTVNMLIEGTYNAKENAFKGTMQIGDRTLQTILFTPGAGLIYYEGTKRTYIGQIFYDEATSDYAIEITDAAFYEWLTGVKREGRPKLIISSPAINGEDARAVYERVKRLGYFK
ncbi:hypothetical protein ACFFSY_08285 [Paenibacillus aurantiacus]|uniref:Lipoprotein n=1 Tax=Paenibacillus aurantiacus TaxID=1936118 RepID=A0ABV5KL79_9BACL